MRKCMLQFTLFLATTLVVSTPSLWAVEKPSFGILGGLHLANLAIHPDPTDASLGFTKRANFGGLIDIGLSPNASLQARCMYVSKGANLNDIEEDIELSATTFIDYITVPVLLRIQADMKTIRPYAVVGPELGFKIRAGAALATTASVPRDALDMAEQALSDQIDDYSKTTDVALDFGGGLEIPSGRFSVLIEGIYSLGLRNIAIPAEGEEGSAKTRTFLFNAGIRF